MLIRIIRDWEDMGVAFKLGEIYHLSDYRQIPESDFWYWHLYHIARDHAEVIGNENRE